MRRASCFLVVLAACGGGGVSGDDGDGGTVDASVPTADARPIIPPDDPGPADVRFTIHTQEDVRAIFPYIYGENGADLDAKPWITATRSGGNRMTAYNWENNASNAGADYLHQNDSYLGGGEAPGGAVWPGVQAAAAKGAGTVVTIPIQGYVAADKDGDGDVNQTPDFLSTRFHESKPRKNSPFSATPDLGDDVVYQDEFVDFVEKQLAALGGARPPVFYCLDNEPDLWSSTHPRIHPAAVGYQELLDDGIAYAAAIKDVAPTALVFGPVSYGWAGYVNLQDAPDAMGRDFLDFYLAGMADAETSAGKRLLDVLDLHWYPEAQGGGVRVTDDGGGAALAAARVQAPRSLWDASYVEESWITEFSTNGAIRLIPRLREKIAAHYPGTRLAFTEYYFGGGAHISGGIAQADVLGIFGREGVFAAMLWHIGNTDDAFIHGGFRMFRGIDGAHFGDTSVRATTDDVEATSIYASVVSEDELVLVAINKGPARSAGVQLSHGTAFTTAKRWQLTAASSSPAAAADVPITLTNAFVIDLPADSVTTILLVP